MTIEISRYPEAWRIALAVLNVLLVLLGLLGNSFTIAALAKYPKVHNVTTVFIINLCISDIIYCLAVLPFNIVPFIDHTWSTVPALCVFAPFVKYMNHGLNLCFIMAITINRYIMIVHNEIYNRVYRKKWTILMIAVCYVFTFVLLLPSALGVWGKFGYDPRDQTCLMVDSDNGSNPKYVLVILIFLITICTVGGCYAKIFCVVHRSKENLNQHMTQDFPTNITKQQRRVQRIEWKITKMILIIFLTFIICFLPYTFIQIFDANVQYPVLRELSDLVMFCAACINPIIYVVMSKQYRRAYILLIRHFGIEVGDSGLSTQEPTFRQANSTNFKSMSDSRRLNVKELLTI